MKNALKNYKTTFIGAALACLYLFQSAYQNAGFDFHNLDIFDIVISSLIIFFSAAAKDADVSGVIKTVVLFIGLTYSAHASAQNSKYDNVYLPAAGVEGMFQINRSGVIAADSAMMADSSGIGLFQRIGEIQYGLNIEPNQLTYQDTAGNTINVADAPTITVKDYGTLQRNEIVFMGYGNGSESGIDTIYLTDDGTPTGNKIFKNLYTKSAIYNVESLNDSLVYTYYNPTPNDLPNPSYITVTVKQYSGLTGLYATRGNATNGTKTRVIIAGTKYE